MARDKVEFVPEFQSIFKIDLSDYNWRTKTFKCNGATYRVDADGILRTPQKVEKPLPPMALRDRAIDVDAIAQPQETKWARKSYTGDVNMIAYDDNTNELEVVATFEDGELVELSRSV